MVGWQHSTNIPWWKRLRTFCLRPHQEQYRHTVDRQAVPPHCSFRRWCEWPFNAKWSCIECRNWAVKRTVHFLQRLPVASIDCQLGTISHRLQRNNGVFLVGGNRCACCRELWTAILQVTHGIAPPCTFMNFLQRKCQAMAWHYLGGKTAHREPFELFCARLHIAASLL